MARAIDRRFRIGVAAVAAAGLIGCATLQQLAAIRNVRFALGAAHGARLAGVDLSRVASFSSLSVTDAARVAAALAQNRLPFEFQVDLRADNPAENRVTARMVRFAWTLLLDDQETISGAIDTAIVIPAGQPTAIPMTLRLDLLQFFSGPADRLVNLAASFAGLRPDSSKVALRAVPTIDTPLGPMSYPSPITVVSATIGGRGS